MSGVKGLHQGLCSLPLTDEDLFILHIKQTDVGCWKHKEQLWAFALPWRLSIKPHQNTDVFIIRETGQAQRWILTRFMCSETFRLTFPSNRLNKKGPSPKTFVSLLCSLRNESLCLTGLLNGSHPPSDGYAPVRGLCKLYLSVLTSSPGDQVQQCLTGEGRGLLLSPLCKLNTQPSQETQTATEQSLSTF